MEVVEGGSEVVQANEKLTKAFEVYRSGPPEIREQAEREINEVLNEAIFKYPDLVNAVEVDIDPRAVSWSDQFASTFAEGGRYNFKRYAELNGGELSTVTLPLPYEFSTGTHGSGERKAGASSDVTVKAMPLTGRGKVYPGIGIQFEQQFMSPNLVLFDASEIRGIKLTKVEKFSPYLDRRDEPKLRERSSPVVHYLKFRGFANPWDPRNAREYGVTPSEYSEHARGTMVGTGMEMLKMSSNDELGQGFVTRSEQGVTQMYEFNNVRVRKAGTGLTENIGRLWFDFRKGKDAKRFKEKVKVYEGDEVVRRLKTIPVVRKF